MRPSRNQAHRWRFFACFLGLLTSLAEVSAANSPHYVFAHYMVCYADYGANVAGYERDIQEAQAAGIDGFVLDVGTWNDPSLMYYNQRVELIYQAAERLGNGFKLSFFVEFWNPTNITNLVVTFANRTNTFWYQGKIVLSAWGMNNVPTEGWVGVDWTNTVLNPLQSAGYPVFFIPHFWPPYARELPSYSDAEFLLTQDGSFVQGLFLFLADGLPYQFAQCVSNYTSALHSAGKTFMASYTPNYWGNAQPTAGRRYCESDGGEGTMIEWQSIIANQPDWVNLVTWNDFNESTYVSPILNPEQYLYGEGFLATPHRYCHAGYLELSKYYISWYKTGRQPPINQDALFYFYRSHPQHAVASDTNDIPVTWWFGDVQDVIYNTVFLTAPAQLVVSSGGNLSTNTLAAGIQSLRTPFAPGPQSFTLLRNGTNLLYVQGPTILPQITNYDFFPASGYAYGQVPPANSGPTNASQTNYILLPPTNLHVALETN
jgi:glucan endo-1,3-alpha-glucosidase